MQTPTRWSIPVASLEAVLASIMLINVLRTRAVKQDEHRKDDSSLDASTQDLPLLGHTTIRLTPLKHRHAA